MNTRYMLIILISATGCGNYFYQFFQLEPDYLEFIERTFFQTFAYLIMYVYFSVTDNLRN